MFIVSVVFILNIVFCVIVIYLTMNASNKLRFTCVNLLHIDI